MPMGGEGWGRMYMLGIVLAFAWAHMGTHGYVSTHGAGVGGGAHALVNADVRVNASMPPALAPPHMHMHTRAASLAA